jgi:hypothetical protein
MISYTSLTPSGRTNHFHVLVHNSIATTLHENNTLPGLVAFHVGQLFFDQSLQAKVEANEPYIFNTQTLTMNAEDGVLATEAESSDPMVKYVYLGNAVTDGILGWISIGIDPRETRKASAMTTYHKDGGVQTEAKV